jgi:hypothetical protein
LNPISEKLILTMQKVKIYLIVFFSILFLAGCQSPKFAYKAPPPSLNSAGPSILIMPLTDSRTNRDMDKVLEKGYLVDVQKAIGDELQSMDFFSSVTVITNETALPTADLKLNPTLRRLEWEIPNYGALETKAFMVGLFTGIIGGSIYAATGIDIYGHSILDVRVDQATNTLFNFEYSDSITNHVKKAVCDTSNTKANMMVQAFQKTMGEVKTDLQKNLSKIALTNSVSEMTVEKK